VTASITYAVLQHTELTAYTANLLMHKSHFVFQQCNKFHVSVKAFSIKKRYNRRLDNFHIFFTGKNIFITNQHFHYISIVYFKKLPGGEMAHFVAYFYGQREYTGCPKSRFTKSILVY
jgi:hypothetical protein